MVIEKCKDLHFYIFGADILLHQLKKGLVPDADASNDDGMIVINAGMNRYAAKSVNIFVLESFNRFRQIFLINLLPFSPKQGCGEMSFFYSFAFYAL